MYLHGPTNCYYDTLYNLATKYFLSEISLASFHLWSHATKFYTLTCYYYSIAICVLSENRYFFVFHSNQSLFMVLKSIASRKAHFNKSIWKIIIILNGSYMFVQTWQFIESKTIINCCEEKIPWKRKIFSEKSLLFALCNTMWFCCYRRNVVYVQWYMSWHITSVIVNPS